MSKLFSTLYAIYFFSSSAVLASIASIICVLTAPFDRNRKIVHFFACMWGYHYIALNPFWRCEFSGTENILPGQTYILVANHQSYWDIMVLYGLFRPFKWVAKEDVMKIPFINWNMVINQYVRVTREDLKSIKEMMAACRNWLARGASIMIFPEGTRSEDGDLGRFRDGPFKLAIESGVKVVPIVLDGTYEIMPKGSKYVSFRSNIVVKVLEPIDPALFNGQPKVMREAVHALMKNTLAELRQTEVTAIADEQRETVAV